MISQDDIDAMSDISPTDPIVTFDHAFDNGRAVGMAVYSNGKVVATIKRDALPYLILKAAQVLQRR